MRRPAGERRETPAVCCARAESREMIHRRYSAACFCNTIRSRSCRRFGGSNNARSFTKNHAVPVLWRSDPARRVHVKLPGLADAKKYPHRAAVKAARAQLAAAVRCRRLFPASKRGAGILLELQLACTPLEIVVFCRQFSILKSHYSTSSLTADSATSRRSLPGT